jgi:hypothetical protein
VGTHQGNLLTKPPFALVHFRTNLHFSLGVFPSLANDTHILGLAHVISFVFDYFCFLVGFCGVVCSTLQVFGLGFIWFTSWV